MHGDIRAHEVVIGGVVVGTIVADERVEIQGTSSVQGDIHTKTIVVLEGGVINGAVRRGEDAVRTAGQSTVRDGAREVRETGAESAPLRALP